MRLMYRISSSKRGSKVCKKEREDGVNGADRWGGEGGRDLSLILSLTRGTAKIQGLLRARLFRENSELPAV
jgi:hypothetical protein